MKLYAAVRNVHLGMGLFAAAGLLLYGVTAVQMTHRSWFGIRPMVTESEVAVAKGIESPRALALRLMEAGVVRGELDTVEEGANRIRIRVARPGIACVIEYTRGSERAKLRCTRQGFWGLLNRVHHSAGLWHPDGLLRVWTSYVAVLSAALILSGVTGIFLWWERRQDRVLGLLLVGVSLTYGVTILLLVRLQG